jgi:hypothetical protein
MPRSISRGLLIAVSIVAGCHSGDDALPDEDGGPDAPTSDLLCSTNLVPAFSDGALVAANATQVFFKEQPTGTLLARSDAGETTPVPAAPSGFGHTPAFTDRSYLSLDAAGSAIATVDLAGGLISRIAPLAPGRKVIQMMAARQETAILLTTSTSLPPADMELALYRAGAESSERLLDSAALGAATSFQVAGDAVVWLEHRVDGDVIKELNLTTRQVSELFTAPSPVEFLQIAGDWLFLFPRVVGEPPFSLRRYSLATGELVTTYSYDYPPVTSVAASGRHIFGASPRALDYLSGCYMSSLLHSFESNGATGTIRPLQHIEANGLMLFHGPNLFFNRETGGGCGGHGNTQPSPPYRVSIGCLTVDP